MLDAIKPLLDNGIINEDTQQAIAEAWESRITEAKEQVRAELREEFAQRYQHDKQVMVEALDKMVTESLTAELSEFADEKKQLAEDRVKFKTHMVESAGKFNNFMTAKLAEEIDKFANLELVGLMSVAPLGVNPDSAFKKLAEIRTDFLRNYPKATILSAGMSEDLEAAILHGATHLRIGSALLGERPKIG